MPFIRTPPTSQGRAGSHQSLLDEGCLSRSPSDELVGAEAALTQSRPSLVGGAGAASTPTMRPSFTSRSTGSPRQ